MHFELKSQSKYRDGVRLGDDVPLIVPGEVYGVFDGATDPARYDGRRDRKPVGSPHWTVCSTDD